jgi:hypothetical protein
VSVDFSISDNGTSNDKVWDNAPRLNVNGGNASMILETLGLPTDPWELPEDFEFPTGQDFLGRVVMARGLAPIDEGMPMHQLDPENARWQGGNRHEGYLQEKLAELEALAQYAIMHGRTISWG